MNYKTSLNKYYTEESVDTEGSWIISYADMITLLAAFFVLFFSADFVKSEEENLAKTVNESLSKMSKSLAVKTEGSEPVPDIFKDKVVHIGRQQDDFIIHFRNVSFFNQGKTEITKSGKETLEKLSQSITPYLGKYLLLIRAFTDKTPVLNKNHRYRDNVELSALRSVSAMRFLSGAGVPVTNMLVAGYGVFPEELKPLVGIEENGKNSLSLERSIVILLKRISEK